MKALLAIVASAFAVSVAAQQAPAPAKKEEPKKEAAKSAAPAAPAKPAEKK
jgi:hypothetical protein